MLGKGIGANVAKYIDVAVVTVFQTLQRAVLLDLVEVRVDFVEQAVVFARCNHPALFAGFAQVEGYTHVGKVHLVHRQLVGVDQRQVNLAFIDHTQEIDDLDRIRLFIFKAGILRLECRKLLGMRATFQDHDTFTHQVARVGGT